MAASAEVVGQPVGGAVIGLGNNTHLFARPGRREALRRGFAALLGDEAVATVDHPGIAEPLLLVRFPAGGSLSIEFTDDAPDADRPRLGAWLELRAADPEALLRRALAAGLPAVTHPGHRWYVMVPGGQVFAIVPAP